MLGDLRLVTQNGKNHFNPYIEVVPVELAGRGYRIEENLYQSMEEAVNDVYNKIVMQIDDSPLHSIRA